MVLFCVPATFLKILRLFHTGTHACMAARFTSRSLSSHIGATTFGELNSWFKDISDIFDICRIWNQTKWRCSVMLTWHLIVKQDYIDRIWRIRPRELFFFFWLHLIKCSTLIEADWRGETVNLRFLDGRCFWEISAWVLVFLVRTIPVI